MTSLIFSILYFFVYLVILKIEKIRFGNILTPFFFLTTPVITIITLNIFSSVNSIFPIIDYRVILLYGLYTIGFLIGGYTLFPIIRKRNILKLPDFYHLKNVSIVGIVCSMALILIAVKLIMSSSNPHYIAGEEFASDYGKGLAIPMLRVISMICLIYLTGAVDKKNLFVKVAFIITLIPFFLYQVKGIILIPIIAGIIFRVYIGRLKINLKLASKIAALGLGIFLITYSLPLIYLGNSAYVFSAEFFQDRISGFFGFLYSGILGFSSLLNSENGLVHEPQRVIAPLWNALRHATGWPRVDNIVSEVWFSITTDNSKISNVFSMFGTLHGYLSVFGTFVASAIIGFFSYILKFMADSKENVWLKILHCFNLSILAFAWFDYYYFYTFVWMFLAALIMFMVLSKLRLPKIVLRTRTNKSNSLPDR